MIRDAQQNEILRYIALGEEMHKESPHFRDMSFDPDKVGNIFANAIANIHGDWFFKIIADKDNNVIGGFLGFICEQWFGHERVAQDLALFVSQEGRNKAGLDSVRVLKQFVKWAKERGCMDKNIHVGVTTGVKDDELVKLYKMAGFTETGRLFILGDK